MKAFFEQKQDQYLPNPESQVRNKANSALGRSTASSEKVPKLRASFDSLRAGSGEGASDKVSVIDSTNVQVISKAYNEPVTVVESLDIPRVDNQDWCNPHPDVDQAKDAPLSTTPQVTGDTDIDTNLSSTDTSPLATRLAEVSQNVVTQGQQSREVSGQKSSSRHRVSDVRENSLKSQPLRTSAYKVKTETAKTHRQVKVPVASSHKSTPSSVTQPPKHSRLTQSTASTRRRGERADPVISCPNTPAVRSPGNYMKSTSSSSSRLMNTPPSKSYSPLTYKTGRHKTAEEHTKPSVSVIKHDILKSDAKAIRKVVCNSSPRGAQP